MNDATIKPDWANSIIAFIKDEFEYMMPVFNFKKIPSPSRVNRGEVFETLLVSFWGGFYTQCFYEIDHKQHDFIRDRMATCNIELLKCIENFKVENE